MSQSNSIRVFHARHVSLASVRILTRGNYVSDIKRSNLEKRCQKPGLLFSLGNNNEEKDD